MLCNFRSVRPVRNRPANSAHLQHCLSFCNLANSSFIVEENDIISPKLFSISICSSREAHPSSEPARLEQTTLYFIFRYRPSVFPIHSMPGQSTPSERVVHCHRIFQKCFRHRHQMILKRQEESVQLLL